MKKYLLIDMSNILYRAFFGNIKSDNDIIIPLCHHSALMSLRLLNKEFKVDEIVAIFDSYSWRKSYTKNSLSHKKYKGTRRQNLTPSQEANFEVFDHHIGLFYEFLKENSNFIVIKEHMLECDDIVEMFITEHPNDEHMIISSDKDFMQLLGRDNVKLYDPSTLKERTLEEYDNDANYFMFQKCIRGDTSDNVISAYPRIRSTEIKKCYNDSFLWANKQEHVFESSYFDDEGNLQKREYKTKELFEENKLLMDLTAQPDFIRTLAKKAINEAKHNKGKFNLIKFIKFCQEHNLERIGQEKLSFSELLMKGE